MIFNILFYYFLLIVISSVSCQVPPKITPWKLFTIQTFPTKSALIFTQRTALLPTVSKIRGTVLLTSVSHSKAQSISAAAKTLAPAPVTSSAELEAPYILHKSLRLNYTEQVSRFFRVYGVLNCRYAFCADLKINKQQFQKNIGNNRYALMLGCQGKKYFLPPQNVTMLDSWSVCCQYGMVPATFSTKQEMECFLKEYVKITSNANLTLLHTSHVDSSLDSLYVTCGNWKSTSKTLWLAGEPDNNSSGDACVLLNVKRGGLEDAACNEETRVLCEEVLKDSIPKPTSNKYIKLNKTRNKSYTSKVAADIIQNSIPYCMSDFCSNKISLNEIKNATKDFNFINACGTTHAILKDLIPKGHKDVWQSCCSIGMVPVSMDSVEKIKCLVETLYPEKSWEKLNKEIHSYHTSQVDFHLNNSFESCITGKSINKSLLPYMLLTLGKSTVDGACISFTVKKTGTTLNKDVCSNGGKVLCEPADPSANLTSVFVETTINMAASAIQNFENQIETINRTVYIEAPIEYFKKSKLMNCASCNCKEHVKKAENNSKNVSLLEFSYDERAFVLTTFAVVYHNVWKQCCELGLVPASIDNLDYAKCIQNKYFNLPDTNTEKSFWTAQVDSTLDRRFISCKSGKPVRRDVWMTGEPNNVGMKEACVAIKLSTVSAGLQDIRCGEPLPVMCEKLLQKTKIVPYTKHKKANPTYQPRVVTIHRTAGLKNCIYANCNKKNNSSENITVEATLNFGLPLTGCNEKTYFIPYPLLKFEMTWQTCCKFGMLPAVFNNKKEIQCLIDLFNKTYVQVNGSWSPNVTNRVYTAHYDSMLDHTFTPCILNKTTPDELWNDNEPNNKGGAEPCAAIDFLKPLFLFDMNCDKLLLQVLCELQLNT